MDKKSTAVLVLGISSLILAILCTYLLLHQNSNNLSTKKEEPMFVCGTPGLIEQDRKNNRSRGEGFFKAKCATCHSIQRNLTGPKLSGFLHKRGNFDFFDDYLKHSDSIVKTKRFVKSYYSDYSFNHQFKELGKQDLIDLKLFILNEE